jgi:thiamine kinase-like enzyme
MEAARDPELRAVMRAVPGMAGAVYSSEPLGEGTSNTNVRVDVRGESFVVRFFGSSESVLGVDRDAEVEAARAAAAAGVGPEVIAYVPEHGCLVTRYVTGRRVTSADFGNSDVLAATVGAIRAFHACPPLRASFSVFRTTERYLRLADDRGVEIPKAFVEAREIADRIEAAMESRPVEPQPCHNELMGENLLWDGHRIWIVDYEFAGMGDPWFDLGDLAAANDLPPATQERLLRLYLVKVTDADRARIALMTIMSDLREAAWALVQQAISPLTVDFADHALRSVERCLERARAAQFDDWLAAVLRPRV